MNQFAVVRSEEDCLHSALIPPCIMIDGVVYYTAAIEDVHQDAKLLFRKPEWMYFYYGGFNVPSLDHGLKSAMVFSPWSKLQMQITDIAGIMLPRVQEALKREKLLEEEKRASEVQARILQAQSDFFLFNRALHL